MKFTNNTFLPQPIYDAVVNDPYDKGDCDYSITGLMQPPRISALTEKHYHEIVEDASERIWSLIGQAVHGILERAERIAKVEERLYVTLDGKRISGKYDRFVVADGVLQDYKVTSVWRVMRETPADFTAQQNAYLFLLNENGYQARSSQLVYLLRDWHKPTARRDRGNYPPYQIVVKDVEVWPKDKTIAVLRQRISLQVAARRKLPLCNDEERWKKPDGWAVKKEGAIKASKLFSERSDAESFVKDRSGYAVERRRSEAKRCLDYCSVAPFCSQLKAETQHDGYQQDSGLSDTGPAK